MKFKSTRRTPALIPTVIVALTMAITPITRAAEGVGAATAPGAFAYQPPAAVDPATGLPLPAPPWKDPNWKDPEKVLAEVAYDGLPLTEVAKDLRKQFKDAFDVLIPNSWQNPYNPAATIEPGSFPVKMQLKNVSASEVFNAMNTVFDIENTPLRWELQLNGKRPTAVIRVLPGLVPANQPQPPPHQPTRMVFFVGDLLSDEKSGGMSINQLVTTVSEVYKMSYGSPEGVLQFHKEAQLLIITGEVDQIQFIQQTLNALKQKGLLERRAPPKAAETKTKADAPKSP